VVFIYLILKLSGEETLFRSICQMDFERRESADYAD
jgi:hypothetical protein